MFHSLRWLPITDFCKDLAPNSIRMTWQTFRAICRMESLKVSLEFRPLRFVRISPSKLQSLLYPEKQQPQPQRRNQNNQQQATTTTTITTTTTTTGHKTRNHNRHPTEVPGSLMRSHGMNAQVDARSRISSVF